MIMSLRTYFCLLLGAAAALPAMAEDGIPANSVEFSLAVGYGRFESPISQESPLEFWLLPRLAWYGERTYFDNGLFGYALQESRQQQWDLVLYPNEDGIFFNLSGGRIPLAFTSPFPVEDHIVVVKTPERDISAMAGLRYGWRHDDWQGFVQAGADVSGVHNGSELSVELACSPCLTLGPVNVGFAAGLAWKSAELVDYYYPPRPGEIVPPEGDYYNDENLNLRRVGPFRSAHGWRGQLQFQALWPLDQRWALLLHYRHFWLSHAMTESPLLAQPDFGAGFAGMQYRF